jgi:hypothetical protein
MTTTNTNDKQIQAMPDEQCATRAYEASATLRQEFGSLSVFLSYWQAQRNGQVRRYERRQG